MIIAQKVISVAFQIHDGFHSDKDDDDDDSDGGNNAKVKLSINQRHHAITKLPSALEFFSYTLNFQGVMAGPYVFYRDYIDFIDGTQYLKKSRASPDGAQMIKEILVEPCPMNAVIKKVIASFVCAFVFMKFVQFYPIKGVKGEYSALFIIA